MMFNPSDGDYIQVNDKSVAPGSIETSGHDELHGSVLLEFLKSRFIRSWTRLRDTPDFSGYADSELDKTKINNLMLHIPDAMHLNVGLDSPTRFETNDGSSLFAYLAIPLRHAWLVDPDRQPELYEAIGSEYVSNLYAKCNDPDSSAEQVELISKFLEATEGTQLTSYGLVALNEELKDGGCCVLYANGHYRVIYNRQGTLFYLVTNTDMSSEHVWKSLELVDDEGFYVTEEFVPLKIQNNLEKAQKWSKEDFERTVRQFEMTKQHTEASEKKKKKKKKKNKKKGS